MKKREVEDFSLDVHKKVIHAYLFESMSQRLIQSEILGLPAPDRGGGFVAMKILHHYDIRNDQKGLLKKSSIEEQLETASDQYKKALLLASK